MKPHTFTATFLISINFPIAAFITAPNVSVRSVDHQHMFPQPERLIALGDLHGDIKVTREALRIAGVLHPRRDEWIGGETVVVQVGDQLDRGDDEVGVLALLHKLKHQASAAGGALHVLAGNHETMNARGNSRYASPGAMARFRRWEAICQNKPLLPGFIKDANHCELYTGKLECGTDKACRAKLPQHGTAGRARFLALRSGSPLWRDVLAEERSAVVVVGNTLFVHGGLPPDAVPAANASTWLASLNADLRRFLAGRQAGSGGKGFSGEALLWNRDFSGPGADQLPADGGACRRLGEALGRVGARRMVVGHSVQPGGAIRSACGGLVWCVDVGMSRAVRSGPPQVLEIRPDGKIRVISAPPPDQDACRSGWLARATAATSGWLRRAAEWRSGPGRPATV